MSEIDYYDVQAMIYDARSEIRGEIENAVREARRVLREELTTELDSVERAILAIHRVLDERTGHLA